MPENRIPVRATVASILLMISMVAGAVDPPSAGSQLRQVPAAPQPQSVKPELNVERRAVPVTVASDAKIVVKELRISNAKRFTERELIAATKFKSGESLTLTQLHGIASQVAAHYHEHGYFLAQATLPPQDVKDGVVTISVLEGQYGNIVVRNHSRLSDGIAQRLVDDLRSGDTVDVASLESGLLRLSDLPGVEIKSTLTPGASVGAADLLIDVTPGRLVSGSIEADNFGNRYTGAYRVGGAVNLNDPFGWGDVASLRILSSLNGFSYGRAAYQFALDRATLGIAYTALDYELGEEFQNLEAHGTAKIAGLYASYPIVRRRMIDLSVVANIESKQFRDVMDVVSPSIVTRKKTNAAIISLVGDRKTRSDANTRGNATNFSITWTSGSLDLLDAAASNSGAGTASEGHYDKLGLSAAHLQPLTSSLSLYMALHGQWAPDNLDVSEKLSLGGPNSVRAFPEGEGYVDEGFVLNAEIRMPLAVGKMTGRWGIAAFADLGIGNLSAKPAAGQENRRTLSGAGLELNWSWDRSLHVKASYAHKVGGAIATSVPDSDSRFWLNAVKFF